MLRLAEGQKPYSKRGHNDVRRVTHGMKRGLKAGTVRRKGAVYGPARHAEPLKEQLEKRLDCLFEFGPDRCLLLVKLCVNLKREA